MIFDVYENTAYELLHELNSSSELATVELVVEIGSIIDTVAVRNCFAQHHPDVVFHAAAHKHVPLMEHNPREAVYNNVFGTRNVAQLAIDYRCSHFVLISTDKAVNPTNVMGATKRMCEMVIQSMANRSSTVFAAVRFGNVLGSHGSVVPLFQRQLKQGGPITLTHRDITRYFMTIPEAARLVITAGALASGGEIYVLNMGEPVRIYDLAANLIKLSGLKVERDVQIEITGLRPGEKLYEELSMQSESVRSTEDRKISVAIGDLPSPEATELHLRDLEASLDSGREELVRVLMDAVPTFQPTTV
ncbi:UDP-glucose 4-epimerase [Actinomyces bovis]|uniref:UDP-glucose 4-epimerase n=1 Tax=Actinomyces bovis TaxID=1658 RepID=A0ABY1VNQ7_9ACTO|nr:UDP-glucose 4-epimerase [Actinomyces bovis]VEG53069.1 UDP-glucose 4-epimerase [Actinomyces israelii]